MKELNNYQPDKIEVVAEQKKVIELIKGVALRKGETLFRYHVKEYYLEPVKYSKVNHIINPDSQLPDKIEVVNEVIADSNFMYVIAINKKNAARKFRKRGATLILDGKEGLKTL